jgi:g-D-glutamyl-meso-diaminopimelate peptidase
VETANPGVDPLNLNIGQTVVLPLPFDVVPTNIPYGPAALEYGIRGLKARYPFIETGIAGRSVMGKPIGMRGGRRPEPGFL